jgi:hypothetical protein
MIMRGEGRRATNLQTVFTETIVDVSLLLIDENLQENERGIERSVQTTRRIRS